jgi:hypothetical protein
LNPPEPYHPTSTQRYQAECARKLNRRQHTGDIQAWRPQLRIPLEGNGTHICVSVADFQVILTDGREELVEVKGHVTRDCLLKEKLFRTLYPDRSPKVVR